MGRTPDFPSCQNYCRTILLEKWLVLIIKGTYKAAYEDIRWEYEPMSDFWPDIDPDSDSRYDGSSDEGRKYQEKRDNQEKGEVVSVPRRNPRRIVQGDQRALILIKRDIKIKG